MMMKKNTIQGYLGGGYVQPLGYQEGGRTKQFMAQVMAGRKAKFGQEAIADATASAKAAKDKILGYGKGLASLAGIAAPWVANAILPGSGLLAGAIGKGLVAGGLGALGRFTGEKLGERLSDAPEIPKPGTWGQEQLSKIRDYREGLRDDSLERSLASGAVAGVTAGVGDKLKTLKAGQKAASDFKNVATAAGDTARASELYQQSGDTGKLLGNIMGVSDGYTPTNAPIADFLSNQRYSYEPTSQGMGYYLDDLVPNQNTLFAGNQQGGIIQGYNEGGGVLENLNSLLNLKNIYAGDVKTESGDLKFGKEGAITREGLAEKHNFPLEEATFDTLYGAPGSPDMAIDINVPSRDETIKYLRRNRGVTEKEAELSGKANKIKTQMMKSFPDEYTSLAMDIGSEDYQGAIDKVDKGWLEMSPMERMRSKSSSMFQNLEEEQAVPSYKQKLMQDTGMEEEEFDAFEAWKRKQGYQRGGLHRLMDAVQSSKLKGAKQQESMERNREGGIRRMDWETLRDLTPNPFTGDYAGVGEGADYNVSDDELSELISRREMSTPNQNILDLLEEKRGGAQMLYDSLRRNPESEAFGNELYTMERKRSLQDMLGKGQQMGGMTSGYMRGGMTPQRNNYRGGGLISMVPFARRIV